MYTRTAGIEGSTTNLQKSHANDAIFYDLRSFAVGFELKSVVESNCGTDVILRIYEFTEIQ